MPTRLPTASPSSCGPPKKSAALIRSEPWPGIETYESRGMPIEVAAPVSVCMPTSWRASPRTLVMSSPGRASEPTARIQIRSESTSTPPARSIFTSTDWVG